MLAAIEVSVRYGQNLLLQDISLELRPGELLVLIGANGAGKSTLLKALSGDRVPDQGRILISGENISTFSAAQLAKKRAVLAQENHLSFNFKALEVVLMGRFPYNGGYTLPQDLHIAGQAMARLDVGHLQQRPYPTLSGGERARVQFARVLCQLQQAPGTETPCLLLDEPTASLDLAHQTMALNVAKQLAHQDGIAVCAVLHDLNLAAQYADRIGILAQGRLLACGKPKAVLTASNLDTAFTANVMILPHPTLDCPLIVTTPNSR